MKIAFWTMVVLIAAVLAAFVMSNRAVATLSLWPLPFVAELPLSLAILSALAIGFLAGALCVWIGGRRRRRELRERGRRIAVLERELAVTRAQLHPGGEPASTSLAARA